MAGGSSWRRVGFYLLLTAAISSIFWYLIIHTGRMGAGRGIYSAGLTWSPGIAGLLTRYRYEKTLRMHGWAWGQTRFQIAAYLLPLAYVAPVYLVVWATGLGGFYNESFLNQVTADFGFSGLPTWLSLASFTLLVGTVGMSRTCATALGEELGWRGFLVPELARLTSFTNVALISGLIWSLWHYPVMLFANYNSGTPAWYGLTCFTIGVCGDSFVYAWLRLKSGSVWPAMLLHGSYNLFVQSIFDPLTIDTGNTEFIVGEFGIATALASAVTGYLFWRHRDQLPDRGQPANRESESTTSWQPNNAMEPAARV